MAVRVAFACLLLLGLCGPAAADERALLVNGDLSAWEQNRPTGWDLGFGAKSGNGPPSRVLPLADGGLILEGDAGVGQWRLVSQAVALEADGYYRLDFEAGAEGRQVDPGQYGSCYVGMMFKDARGERLGFEFHDVMRRDLVADTLFVRVPSGTVRSEVVIFLSMTGRLRVRRFALRALAPEESYDVLVRDMDRNYSFFAAHEIDWQARAEATRARVHETGGAQAFAEAVQPLLASLGDLHVSTVLPNGKRIPSTSWAIKANVHYPTTAKSLLEVRQLGPNALAGRTKDGGFGFLAVASLQQSEPEFQAAEMALRSLRDTPALILDLRANGGGQEARAQRLAAYLAREKTLYARSRWRNGPAHTHLAEGPRRYVVPRSDGRYERPVACLIGPACVSSGEGFAMMMKALPHVVLIGQPTRGASGNPRPVHLPNGVSVHYSRWMSLLPDGTPIERRGVQPDIVVEHTGPGDPTLKAAIAELKKRTAKR